MPSLDPCRRDAGEEMSDMPRGGARNRSGPQPDPRSTRSEQRGLSLHALPNEGYRGEVPPWPLPAWLDTPPAEDDSWKAARDAREEDLWWWAWRTPQAAAWAREPWRWQAVAMWVRTSAICESAQATAADKNALHRFADQIGLTPAGLRENAWAIAAAEIEPAAEERPAIAEPPKRRLRAVGDGA